MAQLFEPDSRTVKDVFPLIRILRFKRTLSRWINAIMGSGLMIERASEPGPTDVDIRDCPHVQSGQVVAYFLHIRARKSASDGILLNRLL
jgi:hypothetical protein